MKKHRITIKLNWASLNKDVQDKAYRMARLAKLGIDNEAAADRVESELTLMDEDMSLLKRAMAQGLAEVITMCREYVWSSSHTSDNYIIKEKDLTVILMMPVNFNLAGCASIGHAIHAYIVGKAMLEWFRYTVPARAAEQQTICDAARKEIETIINARVRTMRGGESLTVIVGDGQETDTVEMLYSIDNERITAVPTSNIQTTTDTSLSMDASAESPIAIAVALPSGRVPDIGGAALKRLGTVTHGGRTYVWWTTESRFEEAFTVTYE